MKNPNSEYFDSWAEEYNALPNENSFHIKYIGNFINKKECLSSTKCNSTIIDLGVGNGRFSYSIACKFSRIIGIDASVNQLKLAENKLKNSCKYLNLVQHDLEEKLPLEDKSIDMVVSNAVIHHIKDKMGLFKEVYRVLKSKGRFIFFDFYFGEIEEGTKKESELMQVHNPILSEKFVSSIRQEHNLMPQHLEETHPEEYHEPPQSLVNILRGLGFRGCNAIPTFYPKYIGIRGVK
ncbi:MAG: class I SAM-dependent methyltransferase [Candidatus Pacearchaeota archaeon]|nr:class I SAM-dependent methyltransferase [Candidatus Pacearchaeota archaeon]